MSRIVLSNQIFFIYNISLFFSKLITTLYPPIALGFTDVTTDPGFGDVRGRATGFGSSSEMLFVLDALGRGFGGTACPPFCILVLSSSTSGFFTSSIFSVSFSTLLSFSFTLLCAFGAEKPFGVVMTKDFGCREFTCSTLISRWLSLSAVKFPLCT